MTMNSKYLILITLNLNFFITYTINPSYIKVDRKLMSSETPANRLNIVARVFYIKFNEFIENFSQKTALMVIFSKIIAYCYSIKFQKRGLLYIYILRTSSRDDKIITSAKVNQIVSAKIFNSI